MESDTFSYNIYRGVCSSTTSNATILHTLGINDENASFRTSARDFRLTDVENEAIHKILA